MKRQLLYPMVGTAMGAALTLSAGCSAESISFVNHADERTINFAELPDSLPAAVGMLASRTVRLDTASGHGTGVILNSEEVLSAGHLLEHADAPDSQQLPCDDMSVSGSVWSSDNRFKTFAQRSVGQTSPNKGEDDHALIGVKITQDVKPLKVRDTSLYVGEKLYAYSFQSHNTQERSPAAAAALSSPAIFGAIALGSMTAGTVDIATGIKSYGLLDDPTADHGASGGPVYDESGRLVGTITASYASEDTADSAARRYSQRAKNGQQHITVSRTIVTLVQPADIQHLEERLQSAPDCGKAA